ncbi:uncharacterized protein LOC144351883 [Saccoglossus kowalevskii]
MIESKRRDLGITDRMLDRALDQKRSTERMVDIFQHVLLTGRNLTLGVLGGSISAGGGLDQWEDVYIYDIAESLQRLLRTKVEVRNGAVGGITSERCLLCLNRFINTSDIDIFFWEFAVNDHGPEGQEKLTRFLLPLPSEPQLVYINFLKGGQIDSNSCTTNELSGSVPLSRYYDIPSISEPSAVCHLIKQNNASDLLIPSDTGRHPSRKAHEMVAVFVRYLIWETLLDMTRMTGRTLPNQRNVSTTYKHIPPLFKVSPILHSECWSTLKSAYTPSLSKKDRDHDLTPVFTNDWEYSHVNLSVRRLTVLELTKTKVKVGLRSGNFPAERVLLNNPHFHRYFSLFIRKIVQIHWKTLMLEDGSG